MFPRRPRCPPGTRARPGTLSDVAYWPHLGIIRIFCCYSVSVLTAPFLRTSLLTSFSFSKFSSFCFAVSAHVTNASMRAINSAADGQVPPPDKSNFPRSAALAFSWSYLAQQQQLWFSPSKTFVRLQTYLWLMISVIFLSLVASSSW